MYFVFNKEWWIRDKDRFSDVINNVNIELMDELKENFFGFMNAPVDKYYPTNTPLEAYSKSFKDKDELIKYVKEQKDNNIKVVLYCIVDMNYMVKSDIEGTLKSVKGYILRSANIQ